MNKTIYLSAEEAAWLKDKPPGYVRALIQDAIDEQRGASAAFDGVPVEVLEKEAKLLPLGGDKPSTIMKAMKHSATGRNETVQIQGLRPCPKCSTLITEKQTSHGKCGWKQS